MSKTLNHQIYQAIPAMAQARNYSKSIESGASDWQKLVTDKTNQKGAGRYLPTGIDPGCELVHIQSVIKFYGKLFSVLDFELPREATGRKGFPKEAMPCAFIVMKNGRFSEITDIIDYLESNLIIAHYCGFNITKPLPSYWTYDRFLKRIENGDLKEAMAGLVKELYERGIVDASFISLDSTPVMANTAQNNPKSFKKGKFSKENHPSSDPDCALGIHPASNQHNEKNRRFYLG